MFMLIEQKGVALCVEEGLQAEVRTTGGVQNAIKR